MIEELRKLFCRYGVSQKLRTDGALYFTSSKVKEFCKEWGVNHVLSAPHYPQSNGLAENAVKTAKYLIKRTKFDSAEFHSGLLELRNTPGIEGRSPAQLFLGRNMRSLVPSVMEMVNEEMSGNNQVNIVKRFVIYFTCLSHLYVLFDLPGCALFVPSLGYSLM